MPKTKLPAEPKAKFEFEADDDVARILSSISYKQKFINSALRSHGALVEMIRDRHDRIYRIGEASIDGKRVDLQQLLFLDEDLWLELADLRLESPGNQEILDRYAELYICKYGTSLTFEIIAAADRNRYERRGR